MRRKFSEKRVRDRNNGRIGHDRDCKVRQRQLRRPPGKRLGQCSGRIGPEMVLLRPRPASRERQRQRRRMRDDDARGGERRGRLAVQHLAKKTREMVEKMDVCVKRAKCVKK